MLNPSMITVVIAGYAIMMLTIVLSLVAAAARPKPKPSDIILDERAVRRTAKPVFTPSIAISSNGGTEVLSFEA